MIVRSGIPGVPNYSSCAKGISCLNVLAGREVGEYLAINHLGSKTRENAANLKALMEAKSVRSFISV